MQKINLYIRLIYLFSVFTIGLHEYGTKNKKLSLVFTKIAKRDAGIYKCVGSDSSGRIYQRDIEIIIVGK